MASAQFEAKIVSAIRGHHVYKDIWNPVIGEVLVCEREEVNHRLSILRSIENLWENNHDHFAIAQLSDDEILENMTKF